MTKGHVYGQTCLDLFGGSPWMARECQQENIRGWVVPKGVGSLLGSLQVWQYPPALMQLHPLRL